MDMQPSFWRMCFMFLNRFTWNRMHGVIPDSFKPGYLCDFRQGKGCITREGSERNESDPHTEPWRPRSALL
jgi:hypothetical protein